MSAELTFSAAVSSRNRPRWRSSVTLSTNWVAAASEENVALIEGLVALVSDADQPAFVEWHGLGREVLRAQLLHVGLDLCQLVEAEVPRRPRLVLDGDAESAAVGDVRHGCLQMMRRLL
jgi:hypothetical protein